MPRFMLDTDTCSYIMKRSNHALLKRLSKTPVNDVCISVITKSELLYGVEVSPRRQQDEAALNGFLRYVEVLDFADEAAPHYADIRAHLKSGGTMIGAKRGSCRKRRATMAASAAIMMPNRRAMSGAEAWTGA